MNSKLPHIFPVKIGQMLNILGFVDSIYYCIMLYDILYSKLYSYSQMQGSSVKEARIFITLFVGLNQFYSISFNIYHLNTL